MIGGVHRSKSLVFLLAVAASETMYFGPQGED